jgi:hypothetical protein
VLKLSRAALLAASLGLAAPALTALPAMAQEATPTTPAPAFTFEIKVPSVVAVDSSMSEDQIKDVFTSNFLSHADQLASLSATSITIPELTLAVTVPGEGGGSSNVTYRDITLTNVKDGLAEKLTVASGETVAQGETTTYKAINVDGVDLKRLFEFIGIVKGDASAPMKPIYSAVASEGSTQSGPMYSCSFGPSSSGPVEARPVKVPFAEVLAIVQTFTADKEPPPEALSTVIGYGVDLFRAVRGGGATVGAIDCDIPADGQPVKFGIASIKTNDIEPGIYPNFELGGIAVDAGPMGTGALVQFVLKAIDFNPTLDALDAAAGQLSDAWFEANWRQLLPSFGGLSLSGFALDAINPENPSGDRLVAKVGSFDLTLGNYVLGIPTDIASSARGIEVPLPTTSTDPQVTTLLAAGLTGVNFGFDVDAAWDKAASTVNLDTLALSAVDLGGMSVSAKFGNATESLFAVDSNVAMNAAFAVTVKEVVINVTDDGLGAIVWPIAAAEQGQTDIEAYRTQMAGFAEGLALQLLGSTDAARQLGTALGDFVTGRKGGVTITITAKDPNGIPMAVFMAAQNDPSVLTGQVDVTGSAS